MRLHKAPVFANRERVAHTTQGAGIVTPSNLPLRGQPRQWMFALAVGALSITSLMFPLTAPACGWWGDAESDASREAIAVDAKGHVLQGNQRTAETPEAVTRQANRLRNFGVSGYAGAVRLYRQAAETSYAPAQNNLGAMYEEGLGVAPDLAEAARWYRRAAEQGEVHAQHSLGQMLLAGHGVERNVAEGVHWIEQAARQDHASACADLGRLYSTGEYLGKDVGKAIHWWQQAERNGYADAGEALKTLRKSTHN